MQMPWRDLPPTGNPIALTFSAAAPPELAGFSACYVNSGTAALALALIAARRRAAVDSPEVILPGYACPDLVSAAVHAGVRPVLVDIGGGDPGYELAALKNALSADTVAVVAVNFLGIRERLDELRELLRQWPQAVLVEDDAQWFPEPGSALSGDAVCLSFGRGKPVSLLGGGALLLRNGVFDDFVAAAELAQAVLPGASYRWKVRAYNTLLHPLGYGLLSRNPLLQLGRTVFKPLPAIAALDEERARLLTPNCNAYHARPQTAAAQLRERLPAALDLPLQLGERSGRLLRYPLLCADGAQRDALLHALRAAGLGASAMYREVLPEIEGVGAQVEVRSPLPGARRFAARLLTLPVHAGVGAADVERMAAIIGD